MGEWKQTTVGKIPSHWKFDKVSNCDLHIGDGNYSSKYPKQKELLAEGVPFISSNDLSDGRVTRDNLRYISPEQHSRLLKGHIKANDVLVVVRGNGVGDVALVDQQFEDANINAQLAFLRSNGNHFGPFLYYLLLNYYNRGVTESYVSGSAQPQITVRQLNEIFLVLPPLIEQKAISAVLSSLDDKIDLLHRQNKTLEALAQTLFRHWFIDGAEDDWEDGVLGDFVDIYDRKRIPLSKMQRAEMKDGPLYPYYGAASIMDYVNDYIFDGEYILMGEDGTVRTDEGYPVLQYATGKFWVNNHAHIFQARKPYSNFYIWCYLRQKNISRIVTGAVQPKINQTNLKSLDFLVAPLDLVLSFDQSTEAIFEKMKANLQQVHTLENLRDTLLPELMSGKVRVRLN